MERLHCAARSADPAAGQTQRVTLLDGQMITVHRLGANDWEAVEDLHRRLTDRERYRRFFVANPKHLDALARRLVQCNDTHYTLGAFESGRLIGVAGYVRLTDPEVAEIAVAVAHEHHLRGVATALLHRLGQAALEAGIRRFVADILLENVDMRRVLSDMGWRPHTSRWDGPVVEVQIDLSDVMDASAP